MSADGYRSYEVYQRQRVHENTARINPGELISTAFCENPYAYFEILRENYPCYRDWLGNCFWVTRYDDVTSIFVDDANFESRSKRWLMDIQAYGADLGNHRLVLQAEEDCFDREAESVLTKILGELAGAEQPDLVKAFAMRFPLELLVRLLDLPDALVTPFLDAYWRMLRGVSWQPGIINDAHHAVKEVESLLTPLLKERTAGEGKDLISVVARETGDVTDLVATLLENDYLTLHGSLANLWCNLLTNEGSISGLREDSRKIKFAYLESQRLTNPVVLAKRYARHEVERFGRLIPEGGLVHCCAGAANRDPAIFNDPDEFQVTRKELCKREPRGSYRADGLASGISFGLGPPSKFPAVPEDRPRSRYAICRDLVVLASQCMLDTFSDISPGSSDTPTLYSQSLGEIHTCWSLPVSLK